MSFWAIAFLGSSTFGGPIVGWFGEHVGPRWGLAIGGLAAIFAAMLGWRALSTASIRMKIFDRTIESAELVTEKERRS